MSHFHGGMVEGHTIQDPRDEPPRTRPFTLLAAVLVLVLIGGAVVYGGMLLVRTYTLRGDNPYPDHWEPKVVRYVDFVERKRGLDFRHPVQVDFLPSKEFNKSFRTDASVIEDEEEVDPETITGMLRAVGMLEGEVDLEATTRAYQNAGVLAFYSPRDERIRIRGTKLTPAVASTLVHELTHALQDQHFDLGGRLELFDRVDEPAAQAAFHAVVEGDASRVQHIWEANLRPKQSAALERSKAAQMRTYKQQTKAIPPIIETFSGAPYALGEALVGLVFRKEGQHAVDRLFSSPPRTDEQLMSPWTFVDEAQPALRVRKPRLGKGEKAFDKGAFGATSWLLMLAERVPTLRALDAADGWGGDSYVAFTRRGESCVRINYRGDTPKDTAEMASALRAWDSALPGGPASVRVDGKAVAFESCDPGTKVSVGRDASLAALRLVVTRTSAATGLISEGLDFATCASNRLVHRFTLKQLSAAQLPPAVQAAIARTVAPCR